MFVEAGEKIMKGPVACLFALIGLTLAAAPGAKPEPVAEGFPVWRGVFPKNHLAGREITASDLRHRITVVVEVKPDAKLASQILTAAGLFAANPVSTNPELLRSLAQKEAFPRDEIYLVSVRGSAKKLPAAVAEALSPKNAVEDEKKILKSINTPCVPVYAEVTLPTEQNPDGKYPFVYILGPTGKEPVFKGVLDDEGLVAANKALQEERKKMKAAQVKWEPLTGSVALEKCPPALVKILEKGKKAKMAPLTPVSKAILKDVVSKDPETATNAQIVYDAIEQTRGDLILRIKLDALGCPHRIAYDSQMLLKYWPLERKQIVSELQKIKESPELKKVAQLHCKIMTWADPSFLCKNEAEAKKIVEELTKVNKDLEKLRESQNIDVRETSLQVYTQVDDLITSIPTRVAKAEEAEK